jgi:Kef-type K+ transport system membrane component KefB
MRTSRGFAAQVGKQPGPPAACRRFGAGDLMVAVAAVALCLTIARTLFPVFRMGLGGIPFDKLSRLLDWRGYLASHPEVAGNIALFASLGLIVLCLVASLAFVLMRLRKPRPSLGQVLLQPGMVAVEGVLAGLLVCVGLAVLNAAAVFGMLAISSAVPVAWAALALTGRWRPEPGWIDRFGRLLGVCWCVLIPVYLALIVVLMRPPLW